MYFFTPEASVLHDIHIQSKKMYDLPATIDYEVNALVEKTLSQLIQHARCGRTHPSVRYCGPWPYNPYFRLFLPISLDLVDENSKPGDVIFTEFGNAFNAKLAKLGYCIKWCWRIHTLEHLTTLGFVCSCVDIDISQEYPGLGTGWIGVQEAI